MTDEKQVVDLDLDNLTRSDDARPRPMVVSIGGDLIRFTDPQDIDYVDLATMDDAVKFVEAVVHPDDLPTMKAKKIPSWKFERLSQAYTDHYAMGDSEKGDASPGM